FFFFQAEDGIRDRNVTGVQTCALPISPQGGPSDQDGSRAEREGLEDIRSPSDPAVHEYLGAPVHRLHDLGEGIERGRRAVQLPRSEERRVGKEGRSRGSREQWRRIGEE